MHLNYLLDTSIISELARKQPHPRVQAQILDRQDACALAALTAEELCFGVGRLPDSKRRNLLERWLETILQSFTLLPYDSRAAQWLGHERARLAKQGQTAARADGEIAAISQANGLILVTRNPQDFAGFQGLKLDNWFET